MSTVRDYPYQMFLLLRFIPPFLVVVHVIGDW